MFKCQKGGILKAHLCLCYDLNLTDWLGRVHFALSNEPSLIMIPNLLHRPETHTT